MAGRTVTFELQTADRTRRARITLPRDRHVGDIVKAGRKRWSLGFKVDYQLANMTTGRQLLPNDTLTYDNIQDNDVLMLQPFPTHG